MQAIAKPTFPVLQRGHPLARGLDAAWLFYEGSGNVAHDAVGKAGASLLVSNVSSSLTWRSPGPFGNYTAYNANTQTPTTYDKALGDFTCVAWFFCDPASATPYARIVDKNFSNGFWFGRQASSTNFGGGIKESASPFGIYIPLSNGTWNQIVSRRQGTTHSIIANGGAQHTSSTVSGALLSADTLAIGETSQSTGQASARWLGGIDNVLMYSRALSDDEIRALYFDPYAPFRRKPLFKGSAITIGSLTGSQTIPDFTNDQTLQAVIASSALQSIPSFTNVETLAAFISANADQTIPIFTALETLSQSNTFAADQTIPGFTNAAVLAAIVAASADQMVPAFTSSETLSDLVNFLVNQNVPAFTNDAVLAAIAAAAADQNIPAFTSLETLIGAARSLVASQTIPAFTQRSSLRAPVSRNVIQTLQPYTPTNYPLIPGREPTYFTKEFNKISQSIKTLTQPLKSGTLGITSISGAPTPANLAPGVAGVFIDTDGGGIYLAYNDAGTIKKVTLV